MTKGRRDRAPRRRAAAKPHAQKKAAAQVLSPDAQWAHTVAELVSGDCHEFQRNVLEDVYTHRQRFITLLVGRGGGKTSAIRALFLIGLASTRRGRFLYFATTREAAEELLWEPMKALVAFHGWQEEFDFADSKLRVTCRRTGATLRLYGMDKPRHVEQHRGKPFDGVAIDEAASSDPKLVANMLDRIIGPRLGERLGWLLMAGTPGTDLRGPFYDFTRPGATALDENEQTIPLHRPWADRDKPEYAGWDGWCSHSWKLPDVLELPNPPIALVNLWNDALKKKRRERWGDDNPVWLREYMGQWAADDTALVFRYHPERNQWDPFGGLKLEGVQALRQAMSKLPKVAEGIALTDWRTVFFGDMGTTHPFAANMFAFCPQDPTRTLWHVFCFQATGMYAQAIADLCLGADFVRRMLRGEKVDHLKSGGLFGVTGWPDALGFDGDLQTITELERVYGIRFAQFERNPNYKHGAIEGCNGDLFDGRIKVLKGSILEDQLVSLQWVEDRFGAVRPNRAMADHCTDCLLGARIRVVQLFDSGTVVAEKGAKADATGYRDPMGLDGDGWDPTEGAPGEYDSLLARAEYGD